MAGVSRLQCHPLYLSLEGRKAQIQGDTADQPLCSTSQCTRCISQAYYLSTYLCLPRQYERETLSTHKLMILDASPSCSLAGDQHSMLPSGQLSGVRHSFPPTSYDKRLLWENAIMNSGGRWSQDRGTDNQLLGADAIVNRYGIC